MVLPDTYQIVAVAVSVTCKNIYIYIYMQILFVGASYNTNMFGLQQRHLVTLVLLPHVRLI